MKEAYFRKEAERNLLPGSSSDNSISQSHASSHISTAFREWMKRNHLFEGDACVVMNVMGSLGNILKADRDTLDQIPVDSSTKKAILNFFSSTESSPNEDKEMTFHGENSNQEIHFQQNIPFRNEYYSFGFPNQVAEESNSSGIVRNCFSDFEMSKSNRSPRTHGFSRHEGAQNEYDHHTDFFPGRATYGENVLYPGE